MNPKCSICGQECKLIPAGISKKTNKPYNAFWTCSDRNCNGKPIDNPEPTPIQNFSADLEKQKQEEKWTEIARGKVRFGFAVEAYKMEKTLDMQTKLEIDEWTNYVMKG